MTSDRHYSTRRSLEAAGIWQKLALLLELSPMEQTNVPRPHSSSSEPTGIRQSGISVIGRPEVLEPWFENGPEPARPSR